MNRLLADHGWLVRPAALLFALAAAIGLLLFLFAGLREALSTGSLDLMASQPTDRSIGISAARYVPMVGGALVLLAAIGVTVLAAMRGRYVIAGLTAGVGITFFVTLAVFLRAAAPDPTANPGLTVSYFSSELIAALVAAIAAVIATALLRPSLTKWAFVAAVLLLLAAPSALQMNAGSVSSLAKEAFAAKSFADPEATVVEPEEAVEGSTIEMGEPVESGVRIDVRASGAVVSQTLDPEGSADARDVAVFSVEGAEGTHLLRTAVAESYDGERWHLRDASEGVSPAEGGSVRGPDLSLPSRSRVLTVSALPSRTVGPGLLPISLYPERILGVSEATFDEDGVMLIASAPIDEQYVWEAMDYEADAGSLSGATAASPAPVWLSLPDAVPQQVLDLARELTAEATSDHERAMALRDFLRNQYEYDRFFEPAPDGREPTEWFLFPERRGVSAHFSSAMTVMARAIGLPARPVAGWAIGAFNDKQTVRSSQAHLWVEVHFDGFGWVAFDPTPGGGPTRVPEPPERESVYEETPPGTVPGSLGNELELPPGWEGAFGEGDEEEPAQAETVTLENGLQYAEVAAGATSSVSVAPEGAHSANETPVFTVEGAAGVTYLRVMAPSSYDGRAWTLDTPPDTRLVFDGEPMPVPSVLGGTAATPRVVIKPLAGGKLGPGYLPTPRYGSRLIAGGPLELDLPSWTLHSDAAIDRLEVDAVIHERDFGALAEATVASGLDAYVQLPDGLNPRIEELARQIAGAEERDLAKLIALELYLRSNYTYDFDFENAPVGREATEWFLFEDQRGVCANFSNAFVMMARSLGLPARPVAGWAIAPIAEAQVVRASQAHQWAEVYFEGYGWVTFDPTPPASGPPSRVPAVPGGGGGDDGTQGLPPFQPPTGAGSGEVPSGGGDEEPVDPDPTPGPDPSKILTHNEVTEIPSTVVKGEPTIVEGWVRTFANDPVSGVNVEIYINEVKENGGTLVGTGVAENGEFSIEVVLPSSTPVGGYHVLARALENETYAESWSDPLITVVATTRIEFSGPSEVNAGQATRFVGRLTEETGLPVVGEQVGIYVDGDLRQNVTTRSNGVFDLTLTLGAAGPHEVEARFEENEFYLGNRALLGVEVVVPTVTSLNLGGNVVPGRPFGVSGSLVATGGSVAGKIVSLEVSGADPVPAVTDASGAFKATLTVDEAGKRQIVASFAGDAPLLASSAALAVDSLYPTLIEIDPPQEVVRGQTAPVRGRLVVVGTDEEPTLGPLIVTNPFDPQGVAVTVGPGGTFEVVHTFDELATHRFQAVYPGSSETQPSSASASTRVVAPSRVTIAAPRFALDGEAFEVTGILLSEGIAIADAPVVLSIDDVSVATTTTDARGRYTYSIAVDGERLATVTAWFAGDDQNGPSTAGAVVSIGTPTVLVSPVTGVRGETTVVRGRVVVGPRGVGGTEVLVSLAGGSAVGATTDAQGLFEVSYPIPASLNAGEAAVAVEAPAVGATGSQTAGVLVGTTITVQPRGRVSSIEQTEVRAVLRDDRGVPIVGAVLAAARGGTATTDANGAVQLTLAGYGDAEAISVPTTVRFTGSANHAPAVASVWLPVTASTPAWVLAGAGLLAFGATGAVAGYLGWTRRYPKWVVDRWYWFVEKTGLPIGRRRLAEEEVVLPPVQVSISLDQPAPGLPPVWGVGEQVKAVVTIKDEDEQPVAGDPVRLRLGDVEPDSVEQGAGGWLTATWATSQAEDAVLIAEYPGIAGRYAKAEQRTELRVVHFREEMTRLFQQFVEAVRRKVPAVSAQSTPREVETKCAASGIAFDRRALERFILGFEEADYSEHEMTRSDYEEMRRAYDRLMEVLA